MTTLTITAPSGPVTIDVTSIRAMGGEVFVTVENTVVEEAEGNVLSAILTGQPASLDRHIARPHIVGRKLTVTIAIENAEWSWS